MTKNMAKDIYELVEALGYKEAHIVGHDIGSQVAYAFAANYPEATTSLTFLDVAAQPQSAREMRLLPAKPLTGDFRKDVYRWWFAFHQLQGIPEEILEGRAHIYQKWFWDALLLNKNAFSRRDYAVLADAYNDRDSIRAGNGWYQAMPQDLDDQREYPDRLTVQTLGIGGIGNRSLAEFVKAKFVDTRLEHLPNSGHYIAEEAPDEVASFLLDFIRDVEAK